MTSRWACFALWGPKAGEILAPLTPDPLDFGYMRMRELPVGDVPVRALRVTFVGEFGWELYCPTEYGAGLWRALWEAGRPHGLRRRRLPGDRLAAAREGLPRLGRGHHPRRDAARGRARLLRARGQGRSSAPTRCREPERRLRCLVLEDPRSVALGNEPVRIDGEVRGRVTSGGYGYAVQRSIAYAYLPARGRVGAAVEIDIFGRWVAGEVSRRAPLGPGRRARESRVAGP